MDTAPLISSNSVFTDGQVKGAQTCYLHSREPNGDQTAFKPLWLLLWPVCGVSLRTSVE